MSAANPLSASTDQKVRDPSMEEILASIRRIIADDQSLPRHATLSERGFPTHPSHFGSQPADPEVALEPDTDSLHDAPFDASFAPGESVDEYEHVEPSGTGYDPMDNRHEIDDPRYRHGPVTPQFPVPGHAESYERLYGSAAHADAEGSTLRPVSSQLQDDVVPDAVEPDSETRRSFDVSHSAPTMKARSEFPRSSHADSEGSDAGYDAPLGDGSDGPSEVSPALFSAATDTAVTSAFNMLAATRLADNSEELKSMVREMIRPLLRSWLDDNLPSMVERMVRAEIERVARGGR